MEKEILVPLDDLQFLELTCPHCHGRIVFDLLSDKLDLREVCPLCNQNWWNKSLAKKGELPFAGFRTFVEKLEGFNARFRTAYNLDSKGIDEVLDVVEPK